MSYGISPQTDQEALSFFWNGEVDGLFPMPEVAVFTYKSRTLNWLLPSGISYGATAIDSRYGVSDLLPDRSQLFYAYNGGWDSDPFVESAEVDTGLCIPIGETIPEIASICERIKALNNEEGKNGILWVHADKILTGCVEAISNQ